LHRRAFENEWASLFEGEQTISLTADNKHSGWWTVSLTLTPESIAKIESNQLSFTLGEFAYQLRAALDGLIWDAVTYTQGAEPSPNAKGLSRLEFPLSTEWKAKDVDKHCFHGFPFPQNLIDWMRTIQPGTADKPIGHPDFGLQNTLKDIHDLARLDRHRRLRVVSLLPITQRIDILETEPPGGGAVAHEWLGCNPLDGKYEVVRFKVVCPGGLFPYKVGLKPDLSFSVFAEDVEPYEGADIGVQLDRFIGAVRRVIDRFNEEFS
jgi:hypothetical protein